MNGEVVEREECEGGAEGLGGGRRKGEGEGRMGLRWIGGGEGMKGEGREGCYRRREGGGLGEVCRCQERR